MVPSELVTVHDWWLQTASIAVKADSAVRDSRKTPATDSTSTEPPTEPNADPATVTSTPEPVKRPAETPSSTPRLLGEVGESPPPPQPANTVASVAPETAWQAPAQNRRRETDAFDEDIPAHRGKILASQKRPKFGECGRPAPSPESLFRMRNRDFVMRAALPR